MSAEIASVLIVDDEPSIRSLLLEHLGQSYKCRAAASVSEACDLLSSNRFDVAIVDVLMPGESGLDLCGIIRRFHQGTRVIVLSAVSDIGYVVQAARAGALSYATKPCDLSYLSRLIQLALRHETRAPKTLVKRLSFHL